jgi:hypothetical protein
MNHARCECGDSAVGTQRKPIGEPEIVDRGVKIRYIFGLASIGPKSKIRR